ncbi:hypothetical protein AX16_005665 [Volvariella volvacea WC 439]|nr:hypothetical protein AX16_005665 [Volvariella volvacea WC 439]
MSDQFATPYPGVFEDYSGMEWMKQDLDAFFPFPSSTDLVAATPDTFEHDIDLSLAAEPASIHLHLLTVDQNDAYTRVRADAPTWGPPSTITVSSGSTYDSFSPSEVYFNNPQSPSCSASTYSLPLDMDLDITRIRMDAVSDYGASQSGVGLGATVDSFGPLPPTPPRSPPTSLQHGSKPYDKPYQGRTAYTDYSGRRLSVTAPDFYSQLTTYTSPVLTQATVSPSHISAQLPLPPNSIRSGLEEPQPDPRKKYKCTTCPRAFARAYNLKTHMATHDPNRLKPHTCPHRSCGRSFSRKHDLGRHLVSIHRDETLCSQSASKKSIGVEKAPRAWCDQCGKGWVGRVSCNCNDVK